MLTSYNILIAKNMLFEKKIKTYFLPVFKHVEPYLFSISILAPFSFKYIAISRKPLPQAKLFNFLNFPLNFVSFKTSL